MAALKALLLGALITLGLFVIIIWIIPILFFLIIFVGVSLIAYAIIKGDG